MLSTGGMLDYARGTRARAARRSWRPRPGCCTRCAWPRRTSSSSPPTRRPSCNYMKMITLPKLRDCLRDLSRRGQGAGRDRRARPHPDRADGRDQLHPSRASVAATRTSLSAIHRAMLGASRATRRPRRQRDGRRHGAQCASGARRSSRAPAAGSDDRLSASRWRANPRRVAVDVGRDARGARERLCAREPGHAVEVRERRGRRPTRVRARRAAAARAGMGALLVPAVLDARGRRPRVHEGIPLVVGDHALIVARAASPDMAAGPGDQRGVPADGDVGEEISSAAAAASAATRVLGRAVRPLVAIPLRPVPRDAASRPRGAPRGRATGRRRSTSQVGQRSRPTSAWRRAKLIVEVDGDRGPPSSPPRIARKEYALALRWLHRPPPVGSTRRKPARTARVVRQRSRFRGVPSAACTSRDRHRSQVRRRDRAELGGRARAPGHADRTPSGEEWPATDGPSRRVPPHCAPRDAGVPRTPRVRARPARSASSPRAAGPHADPPDVGRGAGTRLQRAGPPRCRTARARRDDGRP